MVSTESSRRLPKIIVELKDTIEEENSGDDDDQDGSGADNDEEKDTFAPEESLD